MSDKCKRCRFKYIDTENRKCERCGRRQEKDRKAKWVDVDTVLNVQIVEAVTVKRPRAASYEHGEIPTQCTHCGSPDSKVDGTNRPNGFMKVKYRICRACGRRWTSKVVYRLS